MTAYVSGEQPKIAGLIKLNTNENPYPPPPEVLKAAWVAADERMRVYPDPVSLELREAIAKRYGLVPDQVLMGNGSDEILRMVCMAYLDPGEESAMLWPTYSLYDTFLEMFGGTIRHISAEPGRPLPEFRGPTPRIFFLANPNPPFGTFYSNKEIEGLAASLPETLVVLDEAYVDFAESDGLPLLPRLPNLVITRTCSKSFSLAGMRIGWAMAHPEVIATLAKVKDSYNLDRAQQAVGVAAFRTESAWRKNIEMIKRERERVAEALLGLGFEVPASQGNFLFPRNGPVPAERYFLELRKRNILVRHFSIPELRDGVRVTIGTPEQMDRYLEATREILG
jgi:histidinol-phosphate aminotransferase